MLANKKPRTSYAELPQETKDKRNQRRRELDGNLTELSRAKRNEQRRLSYANLPNIYGNLPESIKDKKNERRRQLRLGKDKNHKESTQSVCNPVSYENECQEMVHTMVPAQTAHPTNLEVVIEAVSAGTIPTDQNGTQTPVARVIREVSSSSLADVSNMVPAQSAHPTNSEVVIDAVPAEAIPKDGDRTQPYVCGTVREVSRSSVHARADENENPHLYGAVLRHMMHGPCGKLNPSNVCFFIDGPGGTGKTFLYRVLLATIRSARNIALATATSGVAASILPGGRTAHSRFKIPLERDGKLTCNVGKQTGLAKLLRATSLIIWDEASMAKRQIIEALDNMLRDKTEVDSLFGGKVVVLGGDFRQVLPVIPKGTKEDCIDASLVRSYIWPYLKKFTLKENMRARTDPAFSSYLLRVGNGEEPCNSNDEITIPPSMIIPPNQKIAPIEQLIAFVFPDLRRYSIDAISMTQSAILAPRNDSVDQTNELLINRFPGKEYVYTSIDETVNPADQGLYVDFMHSVCPPGLPAHRLVLKEDCPVMMLRNLDPSKGLCNGTRLICRKLHKHVIMAEIAIGEHQGDIVFIPRISLQLADAKLYPVQFTRRQFPIRLCFAMTINKAQGQTLDIVGVNLQQPVFSHGQLYVALSRATTAPKIKVILDTSYDGKKIITSTKNIVYGEILSEEHSDPTEVDLSLSAVASLRQKVLLPSASIRQFQQLQHNKSKAIALHQEDVVSMIHQLLGFITSHL